MQDKWKVQFTWTKLIALILAGAAFFPALSPHIELVQQILAGGASGLLFMVDQYFIKKKVANERLADEVEAAKRIKEGG